MIASLIIVPVVSLFTPAEDFEIDPPSRKSAGDVAYEESVEGEGVPTVDSAAMQDVLDTVKSS
jgi:hypothetical protein